jgi:membrane-bound serine protease (ClpP class)
MGKATPLDGSHEGTCLTWNSPSSGPRACFRGSGVLPLCVLLLFSGLQARQARGESTSTGLIVPIPPTITSETWKRLDATLYGPVKRYKEAQRRDPEAVGAFKLVCDFTPEGQPSASEDFGACYDLAYYLRKRQAEGIEVIGWVHGDVTRHSVLPVLACGEIYMSSTPEAHLGKVTTASNPLTTTRRTGYEETVKNRHLLAIVQKMYDPEVEVIKVGPTDREHGTYRASTEKPRPRGEVVLPRGDVALYNFPQAKEYGLCQLVPCNTKDEILKRCGLPRGSLFPPLERTVVWRLIVQGQINGKLKEQFVRRLHRARASHVNLLFVQLECYGGDSQLAFEMGLSLAELNEDTEHPLQTIAFVTREARDNAAFLAFGCNKIVMQGPRPGRGPGLEAVTDLARLGDFGDYLEKHPDLKEQTLGKNLAEVARRQHYPPLLAEGMLNKDLEIVEVEAVLGGSQQRFLSEEEFRKDQAENPPRWKKIRTIKPADEAYLTLDANRARQLGVADDVVADFEELCGHEGIDPSEVETASLDWLDYLADFLRHPWTRIVLVMLGMTCLILELKMPGVGLPGVIAAICFVLFFWAHAGNGQITWLALLLFVLGLVLVGVEIFVVPGTGFCGISGVLLVLVSLGLVTYGAWPRYSEDWVALGEKMGTFGLSILAAVGAAFVLARYLPYIPLANRLLLKSPEEMEENDPESLDPMHSELVALLGAIGVAATPLRPAGKVQFGEDFIDVVAEGSYVQPGTRVQVIEIEGHRVVVKEV